MKPSDIAKHFALNHVGDALGQLLGGVMGVKPSASGGFWSGITSAIPAVFSSDDERKFELLLQELEQHSHDPGHILFGRKPRQYIIWFIQWHFKKRCAGEFAVSWWKQNEFQKFVVMLSQNAGDTGSIDFLTWMVNTIHDAGVGSSDELQNSFTLLADQLEHVPHVPESVTRFIPALQRIIAEVQKGTRQGYRDAKAGAIHHRRDAERRVKENAAKPKSFLDRIIK